MFNPRTHNNSIPNAKQASRLSYASCRRCRPTRSRSLNSVVEGPHCAKNTELVSRAHGVKARGAQQAPRRRRPARPTWLTMTDSAVDSIGRRGL